MNKQIKTYTAIQEDMIFIGCAADLENMIYVEGCRVLVNLCEVVKEALVKEDGIEYIHIPMVDGAEAQEGLLMEAIYTVMEAVDEGKKVGLYCEEGSSKAGCVAAGVLIAQGLAETVEEAEQQVKAVLPGIEIHPALKGALLKLKADPKAFILEPSPVLGKSYTTVDEIIRDRRTVWDFKPDHIPMEKIIELLNVAVWAPTHGLREPWHFTLIQGDQRENFAKAVLNTYTKEEKVKYEKRMTEYYTNIPYHLIISMDEDPRQKQWEEDFAGVCCLIHNLQLSAWEQGIGLVWKTNPYMYAPSFREAFGIKPGKKIVGVLHIGYPSKIYKPRPRTKAEEKLIVLG